jgi:DNA-binding transcriptional ArsR family regulator
MGKTPDCEATLDPKLYAYLEREAADMGVGLHLLVVQALEDFARARGYAGKPPAPFYAPGSIPEKIRKQLFGGTRLTVNDLAERLETTKPAIRSAMHRLKEAGIVKSEKYDHHRGPGRAPKLWELT